MSAFQHVVIASTSGSKKLQIGVKKRPTECPIKSKKGDILHMHYTVRLTFLDFYNLTNLLELKNIFYLIV